MTRDEMLAEMIRIYGFEHEVVIAFAELMENPNIPDHALEAILKYHKEFSVKMNEEN